MRPSDPAEDFLRSRPWDYSRLVYSPSPAGPGELQVPPPWLLRSELSGTRTFVLRPLAWIGAGIMESVGSLVSGISPPQRRQPDPSPRAAVVPAGHCCDFSVGPSLGGGGRVNRDAGSSRLQCEICSEEGSSWSD
jgi:hypothetical protein